MAYHINNEGNAGLCSARSGNCPFAADADHYDSLNAAREAYEAHPPASAAPPPAKKPGKLAQDRIEPEPTVAKEGGVVITPGPYGKPSKDAFFHPRNGFDRADMESLIKSDEYIQRQRVRHDEIMEEIRQEMEALRQTPEGQEKLSAQSQERYRRRVKNAENRTHNGRGHTYYYVSKAGAIRETHTQSDAAIPRSGGFGMESAALAHRDVVVGELQAHGFRKKDALAHMFSYSSGNLA